MKELRAIAKKIPLLLSLYRMVRRACGRHPLKRQNVEQVFTEIYRNNGWGGADSFSGTGSDAYQTRMIAEALPIVFRDYNVSTMLDIPCSDFHWMKNIDLGDVGYIGADIVKELVKNNSERYEGSICGSRSWT